MTFSLVELLVRASCASPQAPCTVTVPLCHNPGECGRKGAEKIRANPYG
ncbi:UNVERIFIED_ORG: hypothetical protein QOE_4087 [Clostridioides difficile F501]